MTQLALKMKQIFINFPVEDLEKSMQFYLALGFTINPLFTDEDQKCLVWSDAIYVMLQTKAFFISYLNKPLYDSTQYQSPSHTLPVENIEQVHRMMEIGLLSGGTEPVPAVEESFMFLRSIQDLDGNLWGIMYLDLAKFKSIKNRS